MSQFDYDLGCPSCRRRQSEDLDRKIKQHEHQVAEQTRPAGPRHRGDFASYEAKGKWILQHGAEAFKALPRAEKP